MRRMALAILAVGAVSGGDLTGTWAGKIPARNNETQDIVFRFVQQGSSLSGKLYGDTEDLRISEGMVTGDEVRFVINTEGYGGKFQWIFSGALKGKELHLTRKREDSVTRSGGDANRPAPSFVLKKML